MAWNVGSVTALAEDFDETFFDVDIIYFQGEELVGADARIQEQSDHRLQALPLLGRWPWMV
jgi:hypothetical protein